MSRYRMFFFDEARGPRATSGPAVGIGGDTEEAAIDMSKRIWAGLAGEETAAGLSLVDTLTGRVCYTGGR